MIRLEKKIVKSYNTQIAVISVKWFYIIVAIKLGLQSEPEILDVNKAFVSLARMKNQELRPCSNLNYRV